MTVEVAKFDPSEPRDVAGRWTSGGGTDLPQKVGGMGDRPWDPSSVKPQWADIKSAVADLRARYPGTKFGDSLLEGHPDKVLPALAMFDRLKTEYPGVKVTSLSIQTKASNTDAATHIVNSKQTDDIELNRKIFAADANAWEAKNPWFVAGTANPAGTLAHEFGHCVMQDAFWDHGFKTDAAMDALQNAFIKATPSDFSGVSGYAAAAQWTGGEAFAEAFNAVANPDSTANPNNPIIAAMATFLKTEPAFKVAIAKGSTLSFSTQAAALFQKAAAEAYAAGYGDAFPDPMDDPMTMPEDEPTDWPSEPDDQLDQGADENAEDIAIGENVPGYAEVDPDEMGAIVSDVASGWNLDRFAANLMGGVMSDPRLEAILGSVASAMYGLYNLGFGAGVDQMGDVVQTTWRAEGDKNTCQPCGDRDGAIWYADEPHPYPGTGRFGSDICQGGPNCRCWLEFDIVPSDVYLASLQDYVPSPEDVAAADEAAAQGVDQMTADTGLGFAAGIDLGKLSIASLRRLRERVSP